MRVCSASASLRRSAVIAAVAAATLAGVTGCGSSSGGTGHKSRTTTTGSGTQVTAARKWVAPYLARPKAISLTTPITKPIPAGKHVDYINCGTPICQHDGALAQQAGKTLGWTVRIINTDGTPSQTSNAWAQILREKPDAVVYQATPRSQIAKSLLTAKAEGITVVADATSDEPGAGLDYVVDGTAQFKLLGPVQAAWVMANSNGHPSVLHLNLPDFPILTTIADSFDTAFAQRCPGCTDHRLSLPLSSIGKNATDLIVSYLRSHPDVKYVVSSDDLPFVGLPAALSAAGITGVKTIGQGPSTNNFQYLSAGQESATIVHPDYDDVYGCMDALARRFAGEPLPPIYKLPIWVITGKTLPSVKALDFPIVPQVISQYEKLWGKQ